MGGMDDVTDDDFDVDAELQETGCIQTGRYMAFRKSIGWSAATALSLKRFSILMDGKAANLVVTDPPYNVNYEGNAGK